MCANVSFPIGTTEEKIKILRSVNYGRVPVRKDTFIGVRSGKDEIEEEIVRIRQQDKFERRKIGCRGRRKGLYEQKHYYTLRRWFKRFPRKKIVMGRGLCENQ